MMKGFESPDKDIKNTPEILYVCIKKYYLFIDFFHTLARKAKP